MDDPAISGMIFEQKRPTDSGRIVTRGGERATVRSTRNGNLDFSMQAAQSVLLFGQDLVGGGQGFPDEWSHLGMCRLKVDAQAAFQQRFRGRGTN